MPYPSPDIDSAHLRARMVVEQFQVRGMKGNAVVQAMRTVPREIIFPGAQRHGAYRDAPLPTGCGQTISQLYIVALMTELLRVGTGDRVLEIGTGSGYQAAVLSAVSVYVYSVERIDLLAIGCNQIHKRTTDGTLGWPEQALFDVITDNSAPTRHT